MRAWVLAAVAVAIAMTTASAGAATYCVPAHTGCSGIDKATLADAVTAANGTTEADDIYLAEGTFPGGVSVGAYPIHIHGAGENLTRIEGGSGFYGVGMEQDQSSISDLTIHEPSGGHATALSLNGSAQRVIVDQRDNASNAYAAVILHGEGSFEDGAALAPLDSAAADYGIAADSAGPQLISGVEVQGRYAVTTAGPGPVTIRFARITGNIRGINAEAAYTLVDDSVVTGAPILANLASGAEDITVTVRHATVNRSYVGVESDVSGQTAHMAVSNTAVVGGDTDPETADVYLRALSGATAILDADYSFYRSDHETIVGAGTKTFNGGSAHHDIEGGDPKLLDLAHGDLRLRFDSPLVDAGDPVPGGGEPMADLIGEFRAVNGRTDIGAYEYGRHTPTVSVSASPASAFVGDPVTFTAGPGDADPNEFPEVTWWFDDGATASGIIVSHAFTTPGTHIVRATATDPTGLTATAPISLTIAAPVVPRPAMAPGFGFKKLKARRGIVGVLLSCPVIATDCSGTIELRLAPKPKAKGMATKTVVLGRKHYALANGTHKTIRVKLTKSARRRLKRARHGLLVKVVAKPKGAASKSKTVRLTGR